MVIRETPYFNLFVLIQSDENSIIQKSLNNSLNRFFHYSFPNSKIECVVLSSCIDVLKRLENLSFENHVKYIELNYSKNFEEIFQTLIEKNGFEKGAAYIHFEKIKRKVYQNLLRSFSHAEKDDLVNSSVGILNILCKNNKEIDTNIKNDAKEKLNKFQNEIEYHLNKYYDNPSLKNEIGLLKYNLNIALELMNDLVEERNKKKFSKTLFFIFEFISKYSKNIYDN